MLHGGGTLYPGPLSVDKMMSGVFQGHWATGTQTGIWSKVQDTVWNGSCRRSEEVRWDLLGNCSRLWGAFQTTLRSVGFTLRSAGGGTGREPDTVWLQVNRTFRVLHLGSARAEWWELKFAGPGPDMESKPCCFNRRAQKEVSKAAEEAFLVKIFLLAS